MKLTSRVTSIDDRPRVATALTVGLTLLALSIVPAAHAQAAAQEVLGKQFEEAGAPLKSAVASGEMSEAQAWAAWNAARREIIRGAVEAGTISEDKATGWMRRISRESLGGRLKEAGGQIRAAAERGEISEDEAWAQWYATRDELIDTAVEAGELSAEDATDFRREIHRAELRERLGTAGGRIKAAVAAGEITEDQAWAEWYATRDELIDTAVEAGEISADDAHGFRDKTHQAELKERISAAGEQIKAAVASGEMTEEEGWAAWAEARDELIAEAEQSGEISADTADEFRRGYERWTVGQRLKAAVASGEMTEEEAWAAWAEYTGETEQIAAKLAEMVERGELTEKQAEAKLLAIQTALGDKAGRAKTGPLDARTVLRAARRVDLSSDQKDQIRDIEREAMGAHRKISRKDEQAHDKLAQQVKAEITKLLDEKQTEQFDAALRRLDRGSRQVDQSRSRRRQ